jgi:hypothetical protein
LFNEGMNTFFPLNPNAASEPLVQQWLQTVHYQLTRGDTSWNLLAIPSQ